MKLKDLPQEFVDMYNLTKIVGNNGNVYIKIYKRECTVFHKQAYLLNNN